MSNARTLVQEVFFDIVDLIDSRQIDDFQLSGFQEFETLSEFLVEQREKLAQIDSCLLELEGE